jgi:hypothetical protein
LPTSAVRVDIAVDSTTISVLSSLLSCISYISSSISGIFSSIVKVLVFKSFNAVDVTSSFSSIVCSTASNLALTSPKKLGSFPIASANSFKVSKDSIEPLIIKSSIYYVYSGSISL